MWFSGFLFRLCLSHLKCTYGKKKKTLHYLQVEELNFPTSLWATVVHVVCGAAHYSVISSVLPHNRTAKTGVEEGAANVCSGQSWGLILNAVLRVVHIWSCFGSWWLDMPGSVYFSHHEKVNKFSVFSGSHRSQGDKKWLHVILMWQI